MDIATFEGSYNRKVEIWIDKQECSVCNADTDCLLMDGSDGEYYSGAICQNCIRDAFKKLKKYNPEKQKRLVERLTAK